jgi:ariadne-1
VAAHPALRFCPHPGCAETLACAGAAGSALLSAVPTVACGAGHALCAGCGMDASHAPLVCSLAARWLQSAREDAGTSQWIKANTRECPKCHGIIEKGGGCKYAPVVSARGPG